MSYSEVVLNQIRKAIAEERNPNPMSAENYHKFHRNKGSVQEALLFLGEWEQKNVLRFAKTVPPSPAYEHFMNLSVRKRNYTDQCWMNKKVKDLKFGHPDLERAHQAASIVDKMRESQQKYNFRPGSIHILHIDTWLDEDWRQHVDRYVLGEFEITSWSGRASPTNKKQVPRLQFTVAGKKPKKSPLVF